MEVKRFVEEEMGYKVIYGDTDSMFVKLPGASIEEAVQAGEVLREKLAVHLVRYVPSIGLRAADPDRFLMDFEKMYDKFIIGSEKKRYAGRKVYDEGKPCKPHTEIKGFEWKRSETPEFSADLQATVFGMLFEGRSVADVFTYVNKCYCDVRAGKVEPYKVAARPSLKKGVDGYKGTFYAATAAKYSQDNLNLTFYPGDRVYCVYVKRVPFGFPDTHLVGLTEESNALPDGFAVDYDKAADVSVRAKVEALFSTIGISHRLDQLGKRSLFDFLGEDDA
jgi:DNA polymerase I